MPSASELARTGYADDYFEGYGRSGVPQVGDVNSTEKGSGARYNAGKPALDLWPLSILASILGSAEKITENQVRIFNVLDSLGEFQKSHRSSHLHAALDFLYEDDIVVMVEEVARVLAYGRDKYAPWNWAKGQAWSVPLASATRHLMAMWDNQDVDHESKLPHRAHVACNIIFLLQFAQTYREGNDLPGGLQA